jgi:hypothetical protein
MPAPGFMRRNTSIQNPARSSIGKSQTMNSDDSQSPSCIPLMTTFLASSSLTRSGSSTRSAIQRSPRFLAFSSAGMARSRSLPSSTSEICPELSLSLKSLYEMRVPLGPDRANSMAANSPSNRYTSHVRRGASTGAGLRGAPGSMGIGPDESQIRADPGGRL